MTETFLIELSQVQPSQLFVSAAKLQRVVALYDSLHSASLDPLPVKRLGDSVTFTDGHTRALAAYLRGQEEIRVVWDEDDLDWEAYEICVDWCKQEGIHCIADLRERVVSPEQYRVLWLQRCEAMQRTLEESRVEDR